MTTLNQDIRRDNVIKQYIKYLEDFYVIDFDHSASLIIMIFQWMFIDSFLIILLENREREQ